MARAQILITGNFTYADLQRWVSRISLSQGTVTSLYNFNGGTRNTFGTNTLGESPPICTETVAAALSGGQTNTLFSSVESPDDDMVATFSTTGAFGMTGATYMANRLNGDVGLTAFMPHDLTALTQNVGCFDTGSVHASPIVTVHVNAFGHGQQMSTQEVVIGNEEGEGSLYLGAPEGDDCIDVGELVDLGFPRDREGGLELEAPDGEVYLELGEPEGGDSLYLGEEVVDVTGVVPDRSEVWTAASTAAVRLREMFNDGWHWLCCWQVLLTLAVFVNLAAVASADMLGAPAWSISVAAGIEAVVALAVCVKYGLPQFVRWFEGENPGEASLRIPAEVAGPVFNYDQYERFRRERR